MGLGNRGMAFEKLINLTNEMYQRGGVALINKRPTPVKVIKSKASQVIKGFYEAKSTVDYDGVYKGRAIASVMFDSMIQFDQDYKKAVNNIEVAKEKIANKKRKLLKA